MILKAENIRFGYSREKIILNDMNFEIEKGDIFSILGRNGVGKTTLLKLLLKIIEPLSGDIYLYDKNYHTLSRMELLKSISFVPQHSNIYMNLTVFDSVLIGLSKYMNAFNTPTENDEKKVNDIMGKFGITHLKNKYLYEISGGELQLTLIARALISEPKIIIMDEPETGLDIKNQIYILKLIKSLSDDNETTVIFNTHYIEHAINFSNKCILLSNNENIFGETYEVISTQNIKKVFGIDIGIKKENNNKHILVNYE